MPKVGSVVDHTGHAQALDHVDMVEARKQHGLSMEAYGDAGGHGCLDALARRDVEECERDRGLRNLDHDDSGTRRRGEGRRGRTEEGADRELAAIAGR